jgi:23S rRNA (cytidine1920-2'-O)/16S rRNA (cytidine1409-2'-O)-methyltransferase
MKQRLDIVVSEKLKISRAKAQALIMAGEIFVDGQKAVKAGENIDIDSTIKANERFPYVSRGALKLEKAVKEYGLNLENTVVCDIGASTGGFADYVLQHGARKVFAIDSGYGQLDQKLRNDVRVVNMERTNIKNIGSLPEKIDFFVIDVSFISLKKVLPQCKKIEPESPVIALIKPQFEVGKEIADKTKGIIKDEKIRQNVVTDISKFSESLGYNIVGVTDSPITGAKGNKEFLIYLT